MYYTLKPIEQNNIYKLKQGYVQPNVYSKDMKKFKIQLPKDRTILDTLNPTFEKIDFINEDLPKQEELYNVRLEELRKVAIKE